MTPALVDLAALGGVRMIERIREAADLIRARHYKDRLCEIADPEYIASWAPPVADAVADWLDAVVARNEDAARRMQPGGAYAKGCDCGICTQLREAFAVADAYLRTNP